MLSKSKLIILIGIFLVVIGLTLVFLISPLSRQPSADQASQSQADSFSRIKPDLDFPVYYSDSPAGMVLDQESITTTPDKGILMFSYGLDNGGQIIVTQQPKPPIMESVKKIKEFNTDSGEEAYIADLEGKITGFVVTGETLIIFSNADKSDMNLLEQLIASFKPL